MSAARETTGARVLRSGGWNTASLVVPQFYLVAISIIGARYLGPTNTGRQSFIAFIELTLPLVLTGGLPYALVRFVGESAGRGEPERARWLLTWALRLEVAAAVLGGGAMILVGLLGSTPKAAWILAGILCAILIVQSVPMAVLAGLQRFRGVSTTALVTGGITVVAITVVLQLGGGITGIFAVEVAVAVVNLAVIGVLVRRALAGIPPARGDMGELRQRVGRFAAYSTANVLVDFFVWRRSEFFFLKHYSAADEIAFYSIAFAGLTALGQISEAIAGVLSPAFATLFGAEEHDRIRSGYARALRLLLQLGFPLTALGVALGPRAIAVVYGSAFRAAGTLLVIMVATLPIQSLHSLNRGLLNALGRQRELLEAGIVAAAIGIALDFLLIPPHAGVGAAIANAVAQLSATLPVLIYCVQRLRPLPLFPGRLVRAGLAAAGLGLAAWGVTRFTSGALSLVAGLAAGLVAFALLALALRILPREDADWLEQTVGGALGGRVGRAISRAAPAAR